MIDQLYRLAIPRPIRSKIYQSVRSKVYDNVMREIEWRETLRDEIDFFVELSPKHIRNLQVFIDREYMLEFMPKNSIVAELGVAKGDFSDRILHITKPRKLHLIDTWDSKRYDQGLMTIVQHKFEKELRLGQVVINQGYSVTELEKFPDRYFDWLFIDTDHSYKTTVQELELCRAKVLENGIIAGHDYITGSWQSKYRYGVVEAVHEFCIKYDWEMIALTHEGDRHLSYAIRQIQGQI